MGAPKSCSDISKTTEMDSTEMKQDKQNGFAFAKQKYEEYFTESLIADNIDAFPTFDKSNLKLGKILGKGGFGTVYEIRGVEVDIKVGTDECKFISEHCLRKETGEARYAIKVLSPEVLADDGNYVRGTLDMAIETRVLSDTDHPNIVKARALAIVSPFHDEYFIMMDRLYDTLKGRIEKWSKKVDLFSFMGGKLFDRKGKRKNEVWKDRIVAAYDLSDALGYLHEKKIVYRDLKPENIGFDIRDDVKLFDFGLAAELRDSRKGDNDLYNLTGMTGSPRYMSPEIANEQQYNEKCDVYSFAILFWQILALKTPFELYTMRKLKERVWNGIEKRPFIDETWPEPIKVLLIRSWTNAIVSRPSFEEITGILREQCIIALGGNETDLSHTRRRSTFVFAGLNMSQDLSFFKSFSRRVSQDNF